MLDTKVQEGKKNLIDEWQSKLGKGDDSWLDELYHQNLEKFLSWSSRKYTLDSEELKDIFQQALVTLYENVVYKRITRLDSNPGTYLFGIAKNLVLKRLRNLNKMERHQVKLQEHWNFIQLDEDTLEETYQAVKKVLNETKDPCKIIIESYYLQGMTIQSIADKNNYKSADVVKTQKSRCMKALKTAVNQLLK